MKANELVEPVAWLYEKNGVKVFKENRVPRYASPGMGFTETPLYQRIQSDAARIAELEARVEAAAEEELKAATGTLAEAAKDLRRANFRDAADLLERKTMPETIAIFKENAHATLKGEA